MSFGLQNSDQTFQRFMDDILRGLDFCLISFSPDHSRNTSDIYGLSSSGFRLRYPDQPGEVFLQSIRGYLPRLQGVL
jgi:hypothetical protein